MGDRNNPIKFGPEWLRNLSREPSAGGSASNSPNASSGPPNNTGQPGLAHSGAGAAGSPGATASVPVASPGGAGASGTPIPGPSTGAIPRTTTNNNASPKVLLAKLRYGREEMLALYDRNAEAPDELKHFDLLYQPRGKPPVALNNTFEEDVRDNIRGGPPIGGISPGERFGIGRGIGRGAGMTNDARGRSRMPFARQQSAGRGNAWHLNNTRMPAYNPGPDEDGSPLRPWNNSNGGNTPNRITNEQPEWTPNKMYRRRQAHNTNWRQPHTRDENEEWRSPENSRNNRSTGDKWDRDWGERPNQDRPQPWSSNRRTWGGNEPLHNEENLPEWAVDNAEAGAGTFDSSGAFHGYSNDDSNLPKSQEMSFPLARSHTHGSFARSKTAEEGSDEWWASEKAKKLSSKKFDAGDIKFKKAGSAGSADGTPSNNKQNSSKDDLLDESPKEDKTNPESSDNINIEDVNTNQNNMFKNQFQESKTFDALMRSDIDLEETRDERGKFHSVMMTPNNSLRQKHQHMAPVMDNSGRHHLNSGILQILQVMPMNQSSENEPRENPEDKLVEEIFEMSLDDSKLPPNLAPMHPSNCINPGMPNQMGNQNMQLQMGSQVLPNHAMAMKGNQSMQMPGLQGPMQSMPNVGIANPMPQPIQNIGIQNSALNSSLGLPMPSNNNGMVMPMPGVPPPVMHNSQMNPIASGMQARMSGFQSGGGMPVAPGNVGNPSLFMGQNNPPSYFQPMQSNDIPMPNHNAPSNMFPMHPLQHSGSGPYGSMYNNMMPPPPGPQPPQSDVSLMDQWYYEDPEKIIQGPFNSKDMYNWYRAGFFSPSLMVRRACDVHMRPLGSYGPVPFPQMEMLPPFPMSAAYDSRPQPTHPQQMGLDESLWSPPSQNPADLMWMQQSLNNVRTDTRVNNLPVYFWEPQATAAIGPNSMLPEEIVKEMKTEDQILRELRESQNIQLPSPSQNVPFLNEQPPTTSANVPPSLNKPEDIFAPNISATPSLDELQKLIQADTLTPPPAFAGQSNTEPKEDTEITDAIMESPPKEETPPLQPPVVETPNVTTAAAPKPQPTQTKPAAEPKPSKQSKNDTEKNVKIKENSGKGKNKKSKEEKKEEVNDAKNKEEDTSDSKVEKRPIEPSPTKGKKEEKQTKKELEKEKKELTKDGFTIVKGAEKGGHREQKKKAEEAKLTAEEAERKRRDEEKQAFEEEKRRRIAEAVKKAQEQQQARMESMTKRAPWSAVATHAVAPNKDGMTLAEIQRLEREKKVEQMKEQQHMMQIIAQQQAAVIAREQEMQAGLGWAKKTGSNANLSGQSLAEIQAETRKQAAAAAATAAAAAAQALDESQPINVPPANHVPWGMAQNGGFWETQGNVSPKSEKSTTEVAKQPSEPNKPKKKVTIVSAKKEVSPAVEFENWCTSVLTSWSSKIDVATFVGFLRDIESPYEVKDYVKCYLGESKDASDFARQFLERRSKLLRVGMVTPSDDLCSPAMAINPRNTNLGDYQEVKSKGKKSKKNKMLKVDARILGFSVTASEDRINVGDIDTV